MSDPFDACAQMVKQLSQAVSALDDCWGEARLAPLQGRDWYELLNLKLLPQLSDQSFLIAAVVGGTNIGKSVVFNHLALRNLRGFDGHFPINVGLQLQ